MYNKRVVIEFECCDHYFRIDRIGLTWVQFSEIDSRSHEDTLLSAVVVRNAEGKFEMEEGEYVFNTYGPGVQPVLDWFETNGFPNDSNTTEYLFDNP